MSSQVSVVTKNVRINQWIDMIRDCKERPLGMSVDTWCEGHGITKANYYYRLKQVRKACLQSVPESGIPEFVELSAAIPKRDTDPQPAAVVRTPSGMILEISNSASPAFVASLIGAMSHAQ